MLPIMAVLKVMTFLICPILFIDVFGVWSHVFGVWGVLFFGAIAVVGGPAFLVYRRAEREFKFDVQRVERDEPIPREVARGGDLPNHLPMASRHHRS